MREFSPEARAWLSSYHGSIDSTALLLAFDAGRAVQEAPAPPEQTEFWSVYGGQGGRRIAQDLPSREAAEKVKRDFDYRLRDYPMPYTTIERQHGRYSTPLDVRA